MEIKKIKYLIISFALICSMLCTQCMAIIVSDFKDLKADKWYEDGINYVLSKGYMVGTSKNTFSPQQYVTRAQIAQILYAMDNKPAIKYNNSNSNTIENNMWYTNAALYAEENKWMEYDNYANDTYFCPNDNITRIQLSYVLFHYSSTKDIDRSDSQEAYNRMEKEHIESAYSREFAWAITQKLICGTDKGLEPNGYVTRAQLAVILKAFGNINSYQASDVVYADY